MFEEFLEAEQTGNLGYLPDVQPNFSMPEESSGWDRFREVMATVLPALAAAGAYKQGALGSFTGGMLDARQVHMQQEQMQARQEAQAQEMEIRRAEMERRAQAEQHAIEEAARRAEAQRQEAEANKQERERSILTETLKPFSGNPLYAEGIPANVAGGTVIQVPGLGAISLKDALERVGVAKQGENYLYGDAVTVKKPEPKAQRFAHYTVTEGGVQYRVTEDLDTGETLRKVRTGVEKAPKEPKDPAPTRRAYNWKDDNPDSETFGQEFRIVEDADGNVISKRPAGGTPAGASVMEPPAGKAPRKVGRFTVVED